MVTFTPDGRRILVANEGEPSGYLAGQVDPRGSVSVIDVKPASKLLVTTISFEAFDPGGPRAGDLPAGVRIYGSPLPSLDLEPEYITVSEDGLTAWVSLQENNAIAVLDLHTLTVTRINALGYKDHSVAGNGLDASDQDGGIVINAWANVFGMYQPDALAAFRVGGNDYVLSANEGDAREYAGLVEAARLRSTTTDASFGPSRANNQAGRLNVTTFAPGTVSDQTTVYAFGARSFSVWDGANGALVYDSGDALEHRTATALPANFNSNNTANNFDNRSDDKGPEPEAATIGVINDRTYGFIGVRAHRGLHRRRPEQSGRAGDRAVPEQPGLLAVAGWSGQRSRGHRLRPGRTKSDRAPLGRRRQRDHRYGQHLRRGRPLTLHHSAGAGVLTAWSHPSPRLKRTPRRSVSIDAGWSLAS